MNDPIYCARFVENLKTMLKERMRWASIRIRDREMVLSLIDACLAGEYPYKMKGVITKNSERHICTVSFDYDKDTGYIRVLEKYQNGDDNITTIATFQEAFDILERLRRNQGVRFRNTVLGALVKKLKFRRSLTDSRYEGVDW